METQAPYLPCFAASDPVSSAEECRKILAIGQARPARAGVMQSAAGSGQPVYERGPDRDSAVTFLDPGPETEWIYQRLFAVAKDANSHNWRFELARSERLHLIAEVIPTSICTDGGRGPKFDAPPQAKRQTGTL